MPKRLTTNEFIEKARKVHDDKYEYPDEYMGSKIKIKIICPIHGEFEQRPNSHLNGHGCDKCARNYVSNLKVKNNEQFIKDAINIHGNKYHYFNDYVGSNIKIKISCTKHGEFLQTPNNHLNGAGCPKCSKKHNYNNSEFLYAVNKKHNNKYKYIDGYTTNKNYIKIICPYHGVFTQRADSHLRGQGCPKCYDEKKHKMYIKTNEQFLKDAIKVHGELYKYCNDYNGSDNHITIICCKHGAFKQTPHAHLRGQGCPFCNNSLGENVVKIWLENNNIEFQMQKKFKNCKDKRQLPFDFYLPEKNICIEYDGEQHYKVNEFFGGEKGFRNIKRRDKIKDEYCKNNNIKLIRIRYDENIINKLNMSGVI